MRPHVRWLPGRESELLLITLLYAALLAITAWNRAEPAAGLIVLVTLELALPVALGIVAAGLMANDPALDLLLSVPQPAPYTLAQRLAALLVYGLFLAALVLLAARGWELPLPIAGVQALLIWAAPAALLVGVATVGALMRGRMLDGAALVLAVAGMALLSLAAASDCPPDLRRPCHAALASPLMTLVRPQDPLWLVNRVFWLSVGGLLLATGSWLVRQEERLLAAATGEE
ncbi:MAG TPA: hypothetical protein VER55_09625 [Ardenticatenaceae bacterium]|nr:hypothetical protein [Ardenticatenaceae bacterium]